MRPIDADALGVGRCSPEILPAAYCAGWNGLLNLIETAPTIDPSALRPKGEWIVHRTSVEAEFKCSECDYSYIDGDSSAKSEYNFCPNCGADMRGESHDPNS